MVTQARPAAAPVRTLPGRYYADAAVFALEQERIFGRSWVCVGHMGSVAAPGSYFLASVGGESVVVLRDRAGAARAYLNVCPHRGARLCMADSGQLKSTIQCGYHAWTFGLDGRLIGAPNMRDDPAFDPAAYGMIPVALQLWENLIWINLSEAPEPLAEQMGGPYTRFAHYHIGELTIGGTMSYDVKANWKLIVENFSECCHCPVMHPELSAVVPSFKAGLVSGYSGGGAELGDGVQSLTTTGTTNRPLLRDLLPEDQRLYYGMTLRPNMFLNLHPDYVLVHVMRPLAADHTQVTCHWLFEPRAMAQPDFDPADAVTFWDLVNRQDWEVCEMTQLGMTSRAYRRGGVYAPLEHHIRGFNDYVLAALGHADGNA